MKLKPKKQMELRKQKLTDYIFNKVWNNWIGKKIIELQ